MEAAVGHQATAEVMSSRGSSLQGPDGGVPLSCPMARPDGQVPPGAARILELHTL